MTQSINANTAGYCYIDLDLSNHRSKLATAAAFVDATDSRYGFSSKDLRQLGGSELARIEDLIGTDHEWSSKVSAGIEIRPPPCGNRILVRLNWDIAPLACENFATLCGNGSVLPGSNEKKAKPAPVGECGKPLTYRESSVHRVVPGFVMQGGDLVFGNGSGGESVFNGKKFKDERAGLSIKHDRKGILSMGNSGKNSNSSQWFLTFGPAPQCDGKHVIFGEILTGWEVLDAVEKLGSASGEPTGPVVVTDCGVWAPFQTPACGYWYDQPDAESFTGVSPVFMVRPRVGVLAPSVAVLDKFKSAIGTSCSVEGICTVDFDTETRPVDHLMELLRTFTIDIIVVAPACRTSVPAIALPSSWKSAVEGTKLESSNVILEAKPIDVMATIYANSWIAQQTTWQVDGKT